MGDTALIIVTWNRRKDVLECVDSLIRAGIREETVTVVDNGSSDGTAEVLEQMHPNIGLISSPRNLGFSGGNNLGIKRALEGGAENICLLNNDIVVEPGFLAELIRAARDHPRAGILGARILYLDRPGLVWSQGIMVGTKTGRIRAPDHNRREEEVPGRTREVDAVSGAAMLIRRDVFLDIGLFDEDYFLRFEDVDLCLRARERGYSVLSVPSSRVLHGVGRSMGGEVSSEVIYYSTRNHLLVMNRRLPLPRPRRILRDLLILGYTLIFALLAGRGFSTARFRAWRDGTRDYHRGRLGERSCNVLKSIGLP